MYDAVNWKGRMLQMRAEMETQLFALPLVGKYLLSLLLIYLCDGLVDLLGSGMGRLGCSVGDWELKKHRDGLREKGKGRKAVKDWYVNCAGYWMPRGYRDGQYIKDRRPPWISAFAKWRCITCGRRRVATGKGEGQRTFTGTTRDVYFFIIARGRVCMARWTACFLRGPLVVPVAGKWEESPPPTNTETGHWV